MHVSKVKAMTPIVICNPKSKKSYVDSSKHLSLELMQTICLDDLLEVVFSLEYIKVVVVLTILRQHVPKTSPG